MIIPAYLEVLSDIQAENGVYFQSRQNDQPRYQKQQAFIADIAKDIPFLATTMKSGIHIRSVRKYHEFNRLCEQNNVIERAKSFRSSYNDKLRGIEGKRDMDIAAIDRWLSSEREMLTGTIERLKNRDQSTER